MDEAEALILAKRESDANKFIAEFPEHDIQVLQGRFGPYIKKAKDNYKIPKGTEAKLLSLDECLSIISEADKSPKKPKRGKKTK